MNKLNYILLVLCAILFFFIGCTTKHCPQLVSETHTTDSSEIYTPITGGAGSPLTVITHPENIPVKNSELKPKIKIVKDTVYIDSTGLLCSHISIDTLRHDSMFVALRDSITCEGIQQRLATFGGKQKQLIVTNTVTKVFEKPVPLFQLNAGVQSSYSKRWHAVDLGPIVSIDIKHKYNVAYSFMLNSSTHNISLQTKMK